MRSHLPTVRHAVITGGAGFIGSSLVDALRAEGGWRITIIDAFDPYYEPHAKRRNLAAALGDPRVRLLELDLTDEAGRRTALAGERADVIVHCAARPGVRQSLADPRGSYDANVRTTEAAMRLAVELDCTQVVVASSSSVYGANPHTPWREDDPDLAPINPYAASKVATETIAARHAERHGLSVPALRLFTVVGPRQRPDLAVHAFARRMLADEPIRLFGDGSSARDYTFVADVVRGLRAAMDTAVPGMVPINLGSGRPVALREVVATLETVLRRRAQVVHTRPQQGEVALTHADTERAAALLGVRARTCLADAVAAFARWLPDADAALPQPAALTTADG